MVSQLADKFLMFSLVILAYHVSRGSTRVAVTLLAYTLPAVLIAPLAGVVADRHDRKLIMWVTSLVRACLIALIPISAADPNLQDDYWHLLAITFAFAAVGQLFGPAEAATIPTVLDRSSLLTANSMVMGTMVVTLLGGGALAPLLARISIYAPYWCASGLFVVATVLLLAAPIPKDAPASPTARPAFWRDLVEGVVQLRRTPALLVSFLQLSLAVLVMFMMFTLAPAFVSTVVHVEAQDSYLILGPAVVGSVVGAAVLGQFGRLVSRRLVTASGLAAMGLTLVTLANLARLSHAPLFRSHLHLTTATFSLLLGLEFAMLTIPAATHLMERAADKVRGRIFALLYLVVNGVTALPVLLAAALSDTLGIAVVIAALGMALGVMGAVTFLFWNRAFGAEAG